MNHEKQSSDLEQLKRLLAKSFDGEEADDIPPLPEELRDRIADQYGRGATSSHGARPGTESFLSRISHLFQTPAFVAVTAVLILLLVATVVFKKPDRTGGIVRNGGGGEPPSLTLVLYELDAQARSAVSQADFDGRAVTTASDDASLARALKADGPRIVLDGRGNRILGYLPGESEPTIEEPLPSDPDELMNRVAAVQMKLDK